jgi:phosphomevalonate kinase
MTLTVTAPGKLMLAGEYAVLHGGIALVVAVDRRVVARLAPRTSGQSEFLAGIGNFFHRHGDHDLADIACQIAVDSAAFYRRQTKLGLGSSAAVTVAAIGCVLAHGRGRDHASPHEILRVASLVHGNVQGARGARGSGADLAASTYGGAISYTQADGVVTTFSALPSSCCMSAFFTGHSADTATLVATVQAHREQPQTSAAIALIASASRDATDAMVSNDSLAFVAALQRNAIAVAELGASSTLDLETAAVRIVRSELQRNDVCVKTTGAGGGDIAVIISPYPLDPAMVKQAIERAGAIEIPLTVTPRGVDITAASG